MPGGTSAAPDDLPGVAQITSSLLTRGTETRTAQEIASEIEQVGGSIGASVNRDRFTAGVFALREDAELAFDLLSDIVQNPTFPETELEVSRQQWLTSLETEFADPESLAQRAFTQLVYGDHPYGSLYNQDTLSAITQADVSDYYNAQADPERAFMVITGDVTAEDGLALAEDAFGDWAADDASASVDVPAVEPAAEPGIYLVDRPGSAQAQFVIGKQGLIGSDPDRYAVRVLNQVFGGTFGARLSSVLREELGYTYGIYSTFSLPVEKGTFSISTAVGNEVAAPALTEIFNQIDLIRDEPVPEDELSGVVEGLIGSEALTLETYQSLVDTVASLRLRGIPLTELEEVNTRYESIDQAAVQDAAQSYVVPDDMIIVVVGDASILEEPLSEIAPVTVIEAP
jgi:zinc protease